MGTMKPTCELELGFTDAENYRRKENKELFNKVFIRNHYLDSLCNPSVSFLIGEKGTGKTAYALYLANNNFKNHFALMRYIRETDYRKFIQLKNENHLVLSDYWYLFSVLMPAQEGYLLRLCVSVV
jgi:polynucleotide 5'-kinase involved in rRNA processing